MAELLPCPFCGGEGRWNWNKDYILCSSCDIAVRPSIWNTRASEAKGEGVRSALKDLVEMLPDIPDKNCSCHLSPPCDDCVEWAALREAKANAQAALSEHPEAKGYEADRGIDWYAAYERMAHNRNELWAKLKAVEAALAATKEGR